MIPRRLIRTVPAQTSNEVEGFWLAAWELHPCWEMVTYRDPLNPADFPVTSPYWHLCESGAQLAGLVRLEALARHGGVYIDSDVELWRPLDPLLTVQAFAGWEDANVVPDAVIGAEPGHPAIHECLDLALARLTGNGRTWRDDNRSWATGPGVTTTVLPGRTDVLLLPPGSFYPLHYTQKRGADWPGVREANPWAFGAHRWHASWL